MARTIADIIASAKKTKEYQSNYRNSTRGMARQKLYNALHNYENKVGLLIASGAMTQEEGVAAIEAARREYDTAFARLPE